MKPLICILVIGFAFVPHAFAKKKTGNKIQEVNFDGDSVDGIVRQPDGMYLVQKKGIDFMPLYKIRDSFDQNIKESVGYLR